MNDKIKLIERMNPFLKILILIVVTLIGSFEFMPFLPLVLTIQALITVVLFSDLKMLDLFKAVKVFIIMSIGYMGFILLARYISGQPLMIISVLGLGFKIILISVYSAIFVKTTDPTELVISLIKYFKVSPKFAYAFLTAYRFLPTFKEEFEIIKHAHQVRGIEESKNVLLKIWNTKRYIIPMMATAVRKGIRISMSMETRAFGKTKSRTYYRKLTLHKDEIIYSIIYILVVLSITLILSYFGLTNLGLKFVS
ncbi:energy-coupling factor transporter transmembrane component T family protein [Metaclostridioides mangenotii]|uniref:energy-coupling factor transporter transmembrane component T family protein n=1 Tax=Metaclostridioides mangenotii TaxID=1540 RepID=UPI00068996DC|nr:energy-coupling factor transporter transmembrane component T [Clostridioides mangenotii]